jgi:hypothetical protein
MTKTEQTYRALIAAARPTAVLVAGMGLLMLSQAGHGMPDWRHVCSWETAALVSFFGYAVFIVLPIQRLPPSAFWTCTILGAILCLGSVWMSKELYHGIVEELFDGKRIFCTMAWILAIPIYVYIPTMILNRRHGAANTVRAPSPSVPFPECTRSPKEDD